MKNRLFKIITAFILMISFSFVVFSSRVKAESSTQDFSGFSFVIVPNFNPTDESGWTVTITWETKKEIKYLEVEMFLEDGHKELVYNSDRANLATKKVEDLGDAYRYTLNFEINSDANLQCIELEFTYSYDEIPNESQKIAKTYLLSTGYTKPKGLSIWSCLLIGIIVSLGAGASTFIIIQNTKKDFLKVEEAEDDDNEQSSYE